MDETGKKVVAVYGGSFDPPTRAHINVASGVLNESSVGIDEVWLMPCINHSFGKKMTDFSTRIKMCEATNRDSRIRVSDFELKITDRLSCWDDDSTMKTIFKLVGEYEDIKFRYIIGLDNALSFGLWKYSEYLRDFVNFIVVPRPGYTHDQDAWYTRGGHVYLPGIEAGDLSSTKIREVLYAWEDRTKEPPDGLKEGVDPAVLSIITEDGLYQKSSC